MVDYWQDLGCAKLMPMGGVSGFEWQEIAAFIAVCGYPINQEEAKTLMYMSRAYARGYADTKPLSIAPMERL